MASDTILELKNITKEFSGVEVLHGINLQVGRGTVHALVGENGAGKSTMMKILSGFYPHGTFGGDIYIDGIPVRFKSIKEAENAGIEIISQELELVEQLAIFENIYLGSEISKSGFVDKNKMIYGTKEIFDRLGLDIDPLTIVGDLGVGKQQMVAIAKALSRDVRILIFDEPTAALTEAEANKLFEIIADLKQRGITCIYISHRLGEVLKISDTITIIRDGKTVITGPCSDFTEDIMITHMVGRTIEDRFPHRNHALGPVVFSAENITSFDDHGRKLVDNVSFEVREGEILGIAGLMGAGRTELVTSIFGAFPGTVKGTCKIGGQVVSIQKPLDAIQNGIGLVVEDRKGSGLVACLDVIENMSLASLKSVSQAGIIDETAELKRSNSIISQLRIKAPNLRDPVERLSGGNQQKVSVAKMLLTKPRVLILDEPTRGVDVGAKYEIYLIMNDLVKQGVAIIMVSSELPEILGMSDRILVMKNGKKTAMLTHEEATQELIMYYATMEERSK